MILSKKRNFLFLRVPKTASTSIHCQLLDSIPENEIDFFTSIRSVKDKIDAGLENERFLKQKLGMEPILGKTATDEHPNLNDLLEVKLITEEEIQNLNIYGVIRNPIDRIISCAHHHVLVAGHHGMMANDPRVRFTFDPTYQKSEDNIRAVESLIYSLEKNDTPLKKTQCNWLKHNGKLINKIFKYDQLDLLMKDILQQDAKLEFNFRSHIRQNKSRSIPRILMNELERIYSEDFDLWESLR